MPNGQLSNVYETKPVGAGGNISDKKARFKMARCKKFKLLKNKSRLNKIYVDEKYIKENLKSKTQLLEFLS